MHLQHKMPDSYGHAKDFFDKSLTDGQKNKTRGLVQYTNQSKTKPQADDLLIFDGSIYNRYGHVAIISSVSENEIEIVEQNPGPFSKSRETISLDNTNEKWKINDERVLGWLRKETANK